MPAGRLIVLLPVTALAASIASRSEQSPGAQAPRSTSSVRVTLKTEASAPTAAPREVRTTRTISPESARGRTRWIAGVFPTVVMVFLRGRCSCLRSRLVASCCGNAALSIGTRLRFRSILIQGPASASTAGTLPPDLPRAAISPAFFSFRDRWGYPGKRILLLRSDWRPELRCPSVFATQWPDPCFIAVERV